MPDESDTRNDERCVSCAAVARSAGARSAPAQLSLAACARRGAITWAIPRDRPAPCISGGHLPARLGTAATGLRTALAVRHLVRPALLRTIIAGAVSGYFGRNCSLIPASPSCVAGRARRPRRSARPGITGCTDQGLESRGAHSQFGDQARMRTIVKRGWARATRSYRMRRCVRVRAPRRCRCIT